MILDLDFWQYRVLGWGGAAAAMLLARGFGRQSWSRAAGIGLMTAPLWPLAGTIAESIAPLLAGGFDLVPLTREEMWRIFVRDAAAQLGYVAAGLVLFAGAWPWKATRLGVLARAAVDAGFPPGRWSEARQAGLGVLLFPLLLLGAGAVQWLGSQSPALVGNDESEVFANMTPTLAVLLALSAAMSEEVVYRGVLQTLCLRGAGRLAGPRTAAALGITAQALVFAFAHSGYGNWLHVLQPFLFALVAGAAAWRLGLWVPLVLHFLVDLYAFGVNVDEPWFAAALGGTLAASVALSAGWGLAAGRVALERWGRRVGR